MLEFIYKQNNKQKDQNFFLSVSLVMVSICLAQDHSGTQSALFIKSVLTAKTSGVATLLTVHWAPLLLLAAVKPFVWRTHLSSMPSLKVHGVQ